MGSAMTGTLATAHNDIAPELVPRQVLSYIHQAAERTECRFLDPAKLSLNNDTLDLPPMRELAQVVIEEFHARMNQRDLADAWEEFEVLIKMAHHLSELSIQAPAVQALDLEIEAIRLARQWALDPRQTPERLHAAIAAYEKLPKLVSGDQVVEGEARLTERTIDQIDEYGIVQLNHRSQSDAGLPSFTAILYARLISPPWERERARRLSRLMFGALAKLATLEPFQQTHSDSIQMYALYDPRTIYSSSPLLKLVAPPTNSYLSREDTARTHRRALIQTMAIRAWQLRHNGEFPERLEDLVPAELSALPLDPYSGKLFRYAPEDLSTLALKPSVGGSPKKRWPPKTRLLYSVGAELRGEAFDIPPIPVQPSSAPSTGSAAAKPTENKPPAPQPKP
jgi:hypothetical protein